VSQLAIDKDFLRRCRDGEEEAIQKFANLSFSNEVERTVQETLDSFCPIDDDTLVDNLIEFCIQRVYDPRLPRPGRGLRELVRGRAMKTTRDWIRHRLKGKK
jgi:hypothetical protein